MRPDRPAISPKERSGRPAGQAASHIRYIREMMSRTTAFTAVPGWGAVAMGVTALVAAYLAESQATVIGWMTVWSVAALVGFAIGAAAMVLKAQTNRIPLWSGQGRKFLLCLLPTIAAGMALTLAVYGVDAYGVDAAQGGHYAIPLEGASASAPAASLQLLPGLWLLLYGAGVISAGIFSVRPVPLFGVCLMLVGCIALLTPWEWGNWWMAAGFGVLQIGFGLVIARRFGG